MSRILARFEVLVSFWVLVLMEYGIILSFGGDIAKKKRYT
jgi:hypothetical protein